MERRLVKDAEIQASPGRYSVAKTREIETARLIDKSRGKLSSLVASCSDDAAENSPFLRTECIDRCDNETPGPGWIQLTDSINSSDASNRVLES
jgi:hypothetical protein